jgi:hypothetical protein
MAKCKLCKINIPEGNKYCEDCLDKGEQKANESYLDSLLNSVKNTAPTAEDIYKKKSNNENNTYNNKTNNNNKTSNIGNTDSQSNSITMEVKVADAEESKREEANNATSEEKFLEDVKEFEWNNNTQSSNINDIAGEETEEIDIFKIDTTDLEDFSQYSLEDDLADLDQEIIINDADLFGSDFSDIIAQQKDKINSLNSLDFDYGELQNQVKESMFNNIEDNNESVDNNDNQIYSDSNGNDQLYKDNNQKHRDNDQPTNDHDQFNAEDNYIDQIDTEDKYSDQTDINHISNNRDQDGIELIKDTDDNHEDNQELKYEDDQEVKQRDDFTFNSDTENQPSTASEPLDIPNEFLQFEDENDMDHELNALLSDLDGTDYQQLVSDDFNNQFDFQNEATELASEEKAMFGSDDDDILSLLNQISSDDPVSEDVQAISDLLNGSFETNKSPSDVGEVFSDALKVVSSLTDLDYDEEAILNSIPEKNDVKNKKGKKSKKAKVKKDKTGSEEKSDENKPKVGFFKRIFGNILDEDVKSENKSTYDDQNEVAATKQQTKKSKKKAAKEKKGSSPTVDEDEDSQDNKGKAKADKKQAKKDKKDKRKKTKEIIQVIDEIEEDEGRINRLGASIVFVFFGLLTMLLLVGSNVVSYSLSIQNATDYFEKQKYTQAYTEVNGIKIKDEDIEIYDKIKTVMFVNKQLNSYNSFYSLKKYPEALDSLLKGLKRYDKYIELATILGIKTDLDYVRSQILAELNNVFNLSEKEAMKMLGNEDMGDYSLKVYDVVLEKMNN